MASAGTAAAPEHWRVRRPVGGPGAAGDWEDVLASTHVGFDVRFTDRGPNRFDGAVVRHRLGELSLVDCMCTPFAGHRGAVRGDANESMIGFQTVRKGAERVRCNSVEKTVTPGEVVVWDGSQQVDIEVIEPFAKRTLILPRDRVLSVCPRMDDPSAIPPLEPGPATRLLTRYLDSLAEELPGVASAAGMVDAATDVALELLRAAVEPAIPAEPDARRRALRADVRRYVRTHLPDPALSPSSVARAHVMSLRSLYSLFEGSGETVAALIRRLRLERCRVDLEESGRASVTDVAFRWGFTDAGHFSRVFKREYGVSPRDVRADHGARKAE